MLYYYLFTPSGQYDILLLLVAVVPAIYLLVKVYRYDRLEKESSKMIRSLLVGGLLAFLLALVLESITFGFLNQSVSQYSPWYPIIAYFGLVAYCEEGSKYLFLSRRTWKSPEFNCLYDGVLYAIFVSLGLALCENVMYVINYGLATGIVRALTAIPGHASFAVFMGIFYASAKKFALTGQSGQSWLCRIMALVVPALVHGAYDYIATMENPNSFYVFLVFVIILFVIANHLVKTASRNDQYMI